MGPTIEPCREPINIDGRRGGQMLEPSFGQSHLPAVPQPKGTDAL